MHVEVIQTSMLCRAFSINVFISLQKVKAWSRSVASLSTNFDCRLKKSKLIRVHIVEKY